jgi:cell division protein YceG involved in septum cleavage
MLFFRSLRSALTVAGLHIARAPRLHGAAFILILLVLYGAWCVSPPQKQIPETIFTVEEGASLHDVAETMKEQGLIRSVTLGVT